MITILKSFIPWILFFSLFGHTFYSQETAVLAALISHGVLNRHGIQKRFVLDIGTLLFFMLFAVNLYSFHYAFITDNGYFISNAALAVIAWISLIIRKPFTAQYAREAVSAEISASPLFMIINQLLTTVWAVLFTLMLLPTLLHFSNFMNAVSNIFLLVIGIILNAKFPAWFADKAVEKKFTIDVKKLYTEQQTVPVNHTKFNAEKISVQCDLSTDVIIIGAGPIGLSSALLLQKFGIHCIVLEKHPGTSIHPKARSLTCRSMELFRKLGVAEKISENQLPKSQDWFGWFSQLRGKVYARIVKKTDYAAISPAEEVNLAQPLLEKILLEQFQQRGGIVVFEHNVIAFSQNEMLVQVSTEHRHTAEKKRFQASYLIAADGSHSTIRSLMNIPMIGPDEISAVFSVYCEINLDAIVDQDKRAGISFIIQPGKPNPMVLSIDGKKEWIFIFPSGGASASALETIYTDVTIYQKIYEVIGCDTCPIHIIGKQAWSLGAQIANQFSAGRAFFAGDSIHRFPPTGGMGMNIGLQDVDNLIWKLALVMKEKIQPSVLNTYYSERIPSILETMQWSLNNLRRIVLANRESEKINLDKMDFQAHIQEQDVHLNKSGLDLGIIYESPIIATTDELKPIIKSDNYIVNSYPGARLPNFELEQEGKMISSLDLIQTDFIFFYSESAKQALSVLDFKSLPVKTVLLFENPFLNSIEGACLFVRPDGHIAWKGFLTNTADVEKLMGIITAQAVSCKKTR